VGQSGQLGGSRGDGHMELNSLLPIANVQRIMKRVLPPSAKLSKEAKACIQECVSEFIGFVTSEASDRLVEDKRKTITGDDVVDSMRALGFDTYMQFLTLYLHKYRMASKANSKHSLKRARKQSDAHAFAPGEVPMAVMVDDEGMPFQPEVDDLEYNEDESNPAMNSVSHVTTQSKKRKSSHT